MLLFLGSSLNFPLGKKLAFVDVRIFALVQGEKIKCKVILLRDEMMGEITEYLFYRTLSIYIDGSRAVVV